MSPETTPQMGQAMENKRPAVVATCLLVLGAVTLALDGMRLVTGDRSHGNVSRIFISAGGPGSHAFVGRGQFLLALFMLILSGLSLCDTWWSWSLIALFGILSLNGLRGSDWPDRMAGLLGLALLAISVRRYTERRSSAGGLPTRGQRT